jgi:hypothetical protein
MAFIRVFTFIVFTVLVPLFLVGQLFAQIAVVDIDPEKTDATSRFYMGYGHLFKTDIDGSGDVSRDGFRLIFNDDISFTSDFTLTNIFSYDFHHYDFSSSSRFQWNDVHFVNYVPLFTWKANDQWSILAAPIVRLNIEGDAKMKDGVTGGGIVGFNYIYSPTLSLGLLIGALDQIEDDALIAPIPVINWKFAEAWMLRTGVSNLGAQNGLGAEIGWHWTPKVELAGGVQFQRRRFRLNTNEQVGQETRIPIYAKLSFAMTPRGKLELYTGVAAGGELRLENKHGKKIREKDYDATGMVGAQLNFVF